MRRGMLLAIGIVAFLLLSFPYTSAQVKIKIPDVQDVVNFFSGNLTRFIELSDTPNAYTGEAGNCTRVNSTEDGVEFIDCVDDGLNVTIDTLTVNNLTVTGNVYVGTCVEQEYELEFTDNAALPSAGSYPTLEGGINLGSNFGRYIPFDSTVLDWTFSSRVQPVCSGYPIVQLRINNTEISDIRLSASIMVNESSDVGLPYNVSKGDNAMLYVEQNTCTTLPDDTIFTVRLKRRCG